MVVRKLVTCPARAGYRFQSIADHVVAFAEQGIAIAVTLYGAKPELIDVADVVTMR
jgi:hypothetical protein